MMGLSFAAPLALVGLLALPLIYLLLRVTPPRPREIVFPGVRLLRGLLPEKETPAQTPWPLLLLRLAIAALVALAMAGPVWSPARGIAAGGPTLIAFDDGWSAAPDWDQRLAAAVTIVEATKRAGAPVALLPMSESATAPQLEEAGKALERLRSIRPKPWLPDRRAAARGLAEFAQGQPRARLVWIADGLKQGESATFAAALQEAGKRGASIEIVAGGRAPSALSAPSNAANALEVEVLRADAAAAPGEIEALDAKGRVVAQAAAEFSGATGKARFDLPVELRNEVNLLRIAGETSAGAVALLDSGAQVRRVAVIGGTGADEAQPLLSPVYYLDKALAPFAQLRNARPGETDPILAALKDRPNIVALADVGVAPGEASDALANFVEDGGLLLRFAGPRLANASDDLTPVTLRRNGRVLGGAMSWETPKRLAEFDATSPFVGLAVPSDVNVTRQVLAEPEEGLTEKTWARLADGTPLVTAQRRGKGMIVLFHVSADTNWSNLPISGLFVDMLRRVAALAGQSAGPGGGDKASEADQQLAPVQTLDGFGALGQPPASAKAISASFAGMADAEHPPGFYGAGDAVRAVQTLAPDARLERMDYAGLGLAVTPLDAGGAVDFRPILLTLVFIGLLIDGLAMLRLSGALRWRLAAGAVAALLLLPAMPAEPRAEPAQKPAVSQRDKEAALTARLAYVISGDPRTDETSKLGLEALSRTLEQRTSFSPGPPVGVDPGRDELAFYPLLYWPISASAPQPSAKAAAKVAAYMKQGGTVVFDTRDALTARAGGGPTPEAAWLQQFTKGLDIPELEVVPRDHVITKTFYLLDGFVGRYANGETWVEALPPEPEGAGAARPVRPIDSVSAIVIVSNDLAAAWAQDRAGQPLYPLTPGGANQREMALRGGVNLVMYTLTGNYKSDQVHVRDLLQRLGQ